MNNYNCYIYNLKKSMKEKLFFLEHIDLENSIIIDFGCADGTLIQEMNNILKNKNVEFIGVEKDDYLRKLAESKELNNCSFVKKLKDATTKISNKNVVMVCSSVLHECDLDEQEYVLHFAEVFCKYLVIRDMYFEYETCVPCSNKTIAKIIKNSNSTLLSDFVAKWGMSSNKSLAHYLLKYTYVDNWNTELQEDYFYTHWDFFKGYLTIYDRKYLLDYKKEQIKKDFDIDFEKEIGRYTHRQVIFYMQ